MVQDSTTPLATVGNLKSMNHAALSGPMAKSLKPHAGVGLIPGQESKPAIAS